MASMDLISGRPRRRRSRGLGRGRRSPRGSLREWPLHCVGPSDGSLLLRSSSPLLPLLPSLRFLRSSLLVFVLPLLFLSHPCVAPPAPPRPPLLPLLLLLLDLPRRLVPSLFEPPLGALPIPLQQLADGPSSDAGPVVSRQKAVPPRHSAQCAAGTGQKGARSHRNGSGWVWPSAIKPGFNKKFWDARLISKHHFFQNTIIFFCG